MKPILFFLTLFLSQNTLAARAPALDNSLEWVTQSASKKKSKRSRKARARLTKRFRVNSSSLKSSLRINVNRNNRLAPVVRDQLITKPNSESYTWLGHFEDEPDTLVGMVVNGPVVVGQITSPAGNFRFKPHQDGSYSLVDSETPNMGSDCAAESHADSHDIGPSLGTASPSLIRDNVISVMVLYTEEAKRGAAPWWNNNNPAYIEGEIDLQMNLLQQALTYSWTSAQTQLVHTQEIPLAEDEDAFEDIYAYRSWVQNQMTSSGTPINQLREAHEADLVSLWVQDGLNACGVGYIGSRSAHDHADYGVTVVDRRCHYKFTFTHELGHNLGLRHDWYMDDTTVPYTYGHGWVSYYAEQRSMMAYDDACESAGFPCPRINRFSNPDLTYGGYPFGHHYIADNARVLDERWQRVANYRNSRLRALLLTSASLSE
ncbi:MAG: hypothetical protein CMH56_04700 [Myxococcales bacterium]|nr:hypothetical protein [Myxococcales bacterium]|tara:strand:+ start:310 stop:1602 length:1293 start_codon:yes stop_codon:yes gene_type:complete